jgi:hypothetical protein
MTTYPTTADPEAVMAMAKTSMWEPDGPVQRDSGPHPAWLRAWPSGHVHYSVDWVARRDGRFDTACGLVRVFWPQTEWPEAKICPKCADTFRRLCAGSGVGS